MRSPILFLTLLLFFLSMPPIVIAQSGEESPVISTTEGLAVQAQLGGHLISTADNSASGSSSISGAGASLSVFYGFTDLVGARAAFSAANVETEQDLTHLDLAGQFSFRSGEDRFAPYARVGFTRVVLSQRFGDALSSVGFTAGLGLHYFLTPQLAADASLDFSLVSFEDDFGGESEGAGTGRLGIGVSWFLTR